MSERQLATAEDLFSAPLARRYETVWLPVKQLWVRIRSLSEAELSAFQMASMNAKGETQLARIEDGNRRLMALCVVDAAGNRLVSDDQAGKFRDWDSLDSQALYNACLAHVGMRRSDIEALSKNSEETTAAA